MRALDVESRQVLKRVSSSLAEIVVVAMQPGWRSHRTTCPDGQFWLPVRGEQVIEGARGNRRQRPFDLLYYAPREPAVRITDAPTLAYGLRVMFSKMKEEERDASWVYGREMCWVTKRTVLSLIQKTDGHEIDEAVAKWVAREQTGKGETARAHWLRQVQDLLHEDPSLSLLELSRAAGVVPSYLSAQFSRTQGLTISAYRRQIMLERALRSAELSNLNVSAIEAGFYDASHFHRACVAELNVKPSSLRRLIWPA